MPTGPSEQTSGVAAPSPDPTLVVAGTLLLDGAWRPGEVWISGERISRVTATRHEDRTGARRIDVGEDRVIPGVVDAHVHSLSHTHEGLRAATRSAAAGGVTTIVEMPFDATGPINTVDRLRAKQDLVSDQAHVDVALLGTLEPRGGWRRAEALADDGVRGFKVSLFDTDPVRFPRIDDRDLLSVTAAVAGTGRTLCAHVENNEVVKGLLAEEAANRDPEDVQAHTRTRPPVAETLGALTAMEIAAATGSALHLCHLSLPRSVDLALWYREQGADVTFETCPHYLTFTSADLATRRGRLKINPPLREGADREGLWRHVAAGRVPVISSDHAPWPAALKDHEVILDNHSGAPGVETLAAVTLGGAMARGPETFTRALEALTIAPARRYGLADRKGSLEVGKDADVAVLAFDDAAVIDEARLHSNAGWSPYDGVRPGVVVTHTIARGELVWSRAAGLTSRDGRGELL
ncbi:dihydroorotase [Litorihabitans aurantiacus]|uniref:Allantoinase n=1 Tax=Litorihabitans aurantiacus TaxID=1930061 RepID=A0AA38CQC4_9MICO|nr:dihydroorotase family protein [Litorihabitans aurantiacus]GMA32243.1 allantoinase [Litorihabitans aurantiacus]